MPITSGDIGVTSLLSAALLGFAGWIRSIANKCSASESWLTKQIKVLETTVIEKSSLIDIHDTNLCAGEKKMNEMKVQLDTLNRGISDLRLLGERTSGKIDALGEKIKTGINEVFLTLNPRLINVEKQIEDLEADKDKK